jgi:hypothetical protein
MKRSNVWLTALLQSAILVTVVVVATPWLIAADLSLPTPRHAVDITLRGQQVRPIFNGSVVPGGVYSLEELRRAIDRDPVVARHYADVNLDEMRVETLAAGRAVYVSYRRGDRVHWTRERVWLKPGETVLTDGTTMIRARCGNCVSAAKQDDVAAVDPAHGELDDFVVPPTPDAGVDAFAADAEAGLGDLLQLPFASQTLAVLTPGEALPLPGFVEDPFGEPGFPFVPPIILPGGGGGGGVPGVPGVTVPPGGPGVGDLPPTPPEFVPPGGEPGTPGLDSEGPGATTGSSSTGTATGGFTTDTGQALTTGASTGGVFPTTTASVSTSSSGVTVAPEPGALSLVAAGVIGLASRRMRK